MEVERVCAKGERRRKFVHNDATKAESQWREGGREGGRSTTPETVATSMDISKKGWTSSDIYTTGILLQTVKEV